MSSDENNSRHDRKLIETWLLANDGQASEPELASLSQELESSSTARELIISVAHQQGWLTWQSAPALVSRSSEELFLTAHPVLKPSWRDSAGSWTNSLLGTRLVSARVMLVVACLCFAVVWLRQSTTRETGVIAKSDLLEARIVGGTPCVWDAAGVQQTTLDSRLREGDSLQLLEGIAELSLQHQATSAKLIMEGPAAVLLARQTVPSLRYGKITIETDSSSLTRFPVETPFGRVMLEPGTEAGISAFGGSAQVHVFAGVATVESPWFPIAPQGGESKTIEAGQALYFEGVGGVELQVTLGTAGRDRFNAKVSMQSDFLAVGPEYVQEIRKAAPVAYWRFDQAHRRSDDASEIVLNEMSDHFNGRIRGKVHWVGPEGNQAIEFGITPEPGSMVVDGTWDEVLDGDYALEAWIKPSHYHLGSIMGFIGEFDWQNHRNEHGVLLEVGGTSPPSTIHQPEKIRFLHRPNMGVFGGVSCFSNRSYKPRQWQHVVAVREGDDLRLFLDGQLVASGKEPGKMRLGLQLVLGQLYSETVERFFIGHMDEVAVYGRALNEDEIQRHYRLLRPAVQEKGTATTNRLTAANSFECSSESAMHFN